MSSQSSNKIELKNQLHSIHNYNADNMFFSEPEAQVVPGEKPINYHRINIYTKNQNSDGSLSGTKGKLLLTLPRLFCFGVNANMDENKKLNGHSVTLCMWNRDAVSEEELKTTELLEKIIQKCKDKVYASKKELKQPKMEKSDLKKLDKLLSWKEDEDGNRVPGVGPYMKVKLDEYKERKDNSGNVFPHTVNTVFYSEDEKDEQGYPLEINPLEYITDKNNKKFCYLTPVVKIDNIYIGGTTITIQCKITESFVAEAQKGQQKLLLDNYKKSIQQEKVETKPSKPATDDLDDEEEEEEEDDDNEL